MHWGVNATADPEVRTLHTSKAPVHWGVNATSTLPSPEVVRLRPLCIGV